MLESLQNAYEQALSKYSQNEYYNNLKNLKEEYFEKFGDVREDDENFEERLSSFNDWYILDFVTPSGQTYMQEFLQEDENLLEAINSLCFSLFEFRGKNLTGKLVVYDLLRKKKFSLSTDQKDIPVLKGDVFTGRLVEQTEAIIFRVSCLLPYEAQKNLVKAAKVIHKKNDGELERNFILKLESLKTKMYRFSHLGPEKVFTLEEML